MKRCPECKRFGIEYDPNVGTERCLWNDCLWVNSSDLNLDEEKFEANFKKFRESFKGHLKVSA